MNLEQLRRLSRQGFSITQILLGLLLFPYLFLRSRFPFLQSFFNAGIFGSVLIAFLAVIHAWQKGRNRGFPWHLTFTGIIGGCGSSLIYLIYANISGKSFIGISWGSTFLLFFALVIVGLFLYQDPESGDNGDYQLLMRFQLHYFMHVSGVIIVQITIVVIPFLRAPEGKGPLLALSLTALALSLGAAELSALRRQRIGRRDVAQQLLATVSVGTIIGDICFQAYSIHHDTMLVDFYRWNLANIMLGASSIGHVLTDDTTDQNSFFKSSFMCGVIVPQILLLVPLFFILVLWHGGEISGNIAAIALALMLGAIIARLIIFSIDTDKLLTQKDSALHDLRAVQTQLVENGKLSALGGLVTGVAHELNTPIGNALITASNIEAQLSVFRQRIGDDSLSRSALEKFLNMLKENTAILTTSLERSAELVRSFKKIRVEPDLEPSAAISMRPFLESFRRLHMALPGESHCRLDVECQPSLQALLPRTTMTQIIDQLWKNACQHAFLSGRDGVIRLHAWEDQRALHLTVSDDGSGMNNDTLKHYFEPFFTTRRNAGNLGLGAYLVHSLVTQRLGGKIELQSRVNSGTTVTIEIPEVVLDESMENE